MNEPILYERQEMQNYFNLQPSEVKGRANTTTEFHKRYLYNKIYSTLEFTIPKEWNLAFFRYYLFHYGSIAVIYTKEFGWICQPYGVSELDLYYQPKKITVTNQFLKEVKTGVIGVNAEIVKVLDDYYGLDDIVTRYAEMLAQIDRSINVNLMNCNVTALFEADSKKQAEEIKEAFEQSTTGKPLVVLNKDVLNGKPLTTLMPNVGQTYIVDKLLTARRTVINAFLTEIGIKNANYDKKERLNSQEVEQNNDETTAILSIIYNSISSAFERINAISDLGLAVAYRCAESDGVEGEDEVTERGEE